MKHTNLDIANQQSTALKTVVATAVRIGRSKERQNQITKERQDQNKISKMKAAGVEQQCTVALLTKKFIHVERSVMNSMNECQSQQLEATDMMNSMTSMTTENEELRIKVIDLEVMVEDGHKLLHLSQLATPVTIIEKERKGQKGRPRWPLYMYNLIMEMLVNGTPPSSVNDNIIAHVTSLSPTTTIKELPSIWTIRRTRTVVLIIVEALAAYRLGKSNKWQQLFTDATTRRQTSFTNLAISIQEEGDDDLYTSLLLSCSICSPNETSEAVVMAIVNTLKDKGICWTNGVSVILPCLGWITISHQPTVCGCRN